MRSKKGDILESSETDRRKLNASKLSAFIDSQTGEKRQLEAGRRKKNSFAPSVGVNIEQQQQIQHAVSQQIELDIGFSKSQNIPIKGMSFDELKAAIQAGELNLRPTAQILSEESLKKNWHRWMGDVLARQSSRNQSDLLATQGIPTALEASSQFFVSNSIDPSHKDAVLYVRGDRFINSKRLSYLQRDPLSQRVQLFTCELTQDELDTAVNKNFLELSNLLPLQGNSVVSIENEPELFQTLFRLFMKKTGLVLSLSSTNPELSGGVTKEAAEQLLNNSQLFQQGLNPLQFDNGFVLVRPTPDAAPILHYLPEAKERKVLFSPKLSPEAERVPLKKGICAKMVQISPVLSNAWEKVKQGDSTAFRRQILQLYSFPEQKLEQLYKFCNDDSSLDYVLAIYKTVNEQFKEEPYDQFLLDSLSQTAKKAFKNDNPNPIELIQLCKNLAEFELKESRSLAASMELYSEYDAAGKQAYTILRAHEAFEFVNKTLFSSLDSYLPLIDDIDKVKNALDLISSFDANKRAWFECLLKQHSQAVGYDDLPTLVESFNVFASRIKDYGLDFYPLPENAFSTVKSLPTALGSMLSILRENRTCDRQIQWKVISELSFDANASMRALSKDKTGKCDFILPEMRVEPKHYDMTFGYGTSSNPRAFQEGKSLEEIRANFYRYLAQQKSKLPLSFYQAMDKVILEKFPIDENIPNATKLTNLGMFYALLVSSTTGEDNSLFHGANEAAIKETEQLWITLLQAMKDYEMPLISKFMGDTDDTNYRTMLNTGFNLAKNPNLLVIKQAITLELQVTSSLAGMLAAAYSGLLGDCKAIRNGFANRYGISIYKAMHFYSDQLKNPKDDQDEFFRNFYHKAILLIAGPIKQIADPSYKNFGVSSNFLDGNREPYPYEGLLAVISHFRLDKAEDAQVLELRETFITACKANPERVAEALKLIQGMESVNSRWTYATLDQFFKELAEQQDKKPSALVKETFGEKHFPSGFFELCDAKTLPPRTLELIDNYFASEQRPAVVTMLKIFGQNVSRSEEDYAKILYNFAGRINNLPAEEAKGLFKHLTKPAIHGQSLDDCYKLLYTLSTIKAVQNFIYFADRTAGLQVKDLTTKATIFLIQAEHLCSQFQPPLSEKIILNLLIEKILVSGQPPEEQFYALVVKLVDSYPQTKDKILDYLPEFVQKYKADDYKILSQLKDSVQDQDQVLSIFSHLLEAEKPLDLSFLIGVDYSNLDNKPLFWKILVQILNNNFPVGQLNSFISTFNRHKKKLAKIYHSAPYPSLEKAAELLNGENFEAQLSEFNYSPFAKSPLNRFDSTRAKSYLNLIQANRFGDSQYTDFTSDELVKFTNEIADANLLKVEEVKAQLANKGIGFSKLVALNARLLYLSTGIECNTIQYLAVLSLLKNGKRNIGQLETGEGKSRINMLLAACQHQRGTTVDFITKDMLLAERDYLSYKAFFDALGAETKLIYSTTPIEAYKKEGIHFTTIADLAHFRGAAHAEGRLAEVLDEPEKRTAIIDESDYIFFGLHASQFNLAMPDPSMSKLAFVYEEMIEFFYQNPQAKDLNVEACDLEFIRFLRNNDSGSGNALLFEAVDLKQRLFWQDAALVALGMRLNDKFTVRVNVQKETAEGVKVASEVVALAEDKRPTKGEFTDGVHQFLQARLELLRQRRAPGVLEPQDREIMAFFAEHPNAQAFAKKVESIVYYSVAANNLIHDYLVGFIYGSTATPRTKDLQRESHLFNGVENTIFFPPANPSQRITHPTYLSANELGQWKRIAEEIREAQAHNQPYLLICENDTETKKINDYLASIEKIQNVTRLFTGTSSKDEKIHIKKAGLPGQVTITTSVHGRGTDVVLDEKAKVKGLKVGVTYLPQSSDEQKQLFGRAARFGSSGEAGFILNKEREKARLSKESLTDGFYFSAEQYLENQLALSERRTQKERIIQYTQAAFLSVLQSEFYTQLHTGKRGEEEIKDLRNDWAQFHKRSQRLWKEMVSDFSSETDLETINTKFQDYKTEVQKDWTENLKNFDLPEVSLSLGKEEYKFLFDPIPPKKLQVPVVDSYHPAHDGRAVLYSNPFEKWRALFSGERPVFADFRAWLDGRGILFPNLRAWWSGAMTTNQLLFGCEKLSPETLKALKYALRVSLVILFGLLVGGIGGALAATGVFAPFGAGLIGTSIMVAIGFGTGALTLGAPATLVNYLLDDDEAELEVKEGADIKINQSYDKMFPLDYSQENNDPSELGTDPAIASKTKSRIRVVEKEEKHEISNSFDLKG